MSSSILQDVDTLNSQEDQRKNTSWLKRWIIGPLGFSKSYNFPLWFIFAGALFGFSLARLSYLNIDGGDLKSSFSGGASPGEWFHYREGHYRVGITIHLAAILPLGILVIWQFLPIIRHKFLLFHRLNGYTCLLLLLTSNAGALMIARRAFGGSLETQAGIGLLVVMTTISAALAYYNIKRLQIDQHRAWMLRTFFYMASIITLRIIMIISAKIISGIGGYYQIQTCEQVSFVRDSSSLAAELYSACMNAAGDTLILVPASWEGGENVGAALGLSFGAALWLALFLHAAGVEIYLGLTPAEGERLRVVSWERQVEAGYKDPGSAGLTVQRWGDAKAWCPPTGSIDIEK